MACSPRNLSSPPQRHRRHSPDLLLITIEDIKTIAPHLDTLTRLDYTLGYLRVAHDVIFIC